jgi:hypothetical protein
MMKIWITGAAAVGAFSLAVPATAGKPAVLLAQSGTWRSSADGTFWSDGKLPKDFSLRIVLRFAQGTLHYYSINETDPAKPTTLEYEAPTDGTVITIAGQARYNQVSVRQLGAGEYQLLKMKDGDVIVGEFWTFRPDGKTLVRRGVGKATDGVSKAFQETFHRSPSSQGGEI